jgi:hypothetical protein
MALFDRFHENNSKSKLEDLRKLHCVEELYGQVNSQVAEQLHKSFNSNKRFLNAMSPHHFAYLMRSMLNHRNELKNAEFIEKQKSKGYDIYRNELGKIRFKLGFDGTLTNTQTISASDRLNSIDFLIGKPDIIENTSVGDKISESRAEGDGGDAHSRDLPSCVTEDESRNIFDILNQQSDEASLNENDSKIELPILVLSKVFKFYYASMGNKLETLKLVCKKWKKVANEIPTHVLKILYLSRCMRIIESKPKYEKLYRDIYHALQYPLTQ